MNDICASRPNPAPTARNAHHRRQATKGTPHAAIIALFRVVNRYVGNLPPMPGVFPDYPAPVVRNAGAERKLTRMRWGMPPSKGGPPVANIRKYVVAALARLDEAREPVPGPVQQLCGNTHRRPIRRQR